jgi:hypothetical protein
MEYFAKSVAKIFYVLCAAVISILFIAYPVLAASPTPDDPITEASRGNIPAGWTLAGLLVLLLFFMIYQQVRKFILRVIRRSRNKG